MSYSSSSAITSSTMSSESAPRSSMKDASGVTSSSLTPSCSQMISFTFCSTLAAIVLLLTWLSRPPASHVEATVHVEDVSGDVPRAGGSEKDDRRRDLVGRRHAPRRNDARVKALLRVAQRRHHVGLDESWRDGVDGDAARGDLARQRLREADHPGLGGGVRRLPRISHLRDDGGEIDDTAVMGPDHGPERPARAVKDTRQGDSQGAPPVLCLETQEQRRHRQSGTVDEQITSSSVVNDVLHRVTHGLAVPDIEARGTRDTAACGDRPDGLLG